MCKRWVNTFSGWNLSKEYEHVIAAFVEHRLPKRTKEILREVNKYRDMSYTAAVYRISNDLRIAPSTIRWSMKLLRELGLIICGDEKYRGDRMRSSNAGEVAIRHLNGGKYSKPKEFYRQNDNKKQDVILDEGYRESVLKFYSYMDTLGNRNSQNSS